MKYLLLAGVAFLSSEAALAAQPAPDNAPAQDKAETDNQAAEPVVQEIVVTSTRSILPATALPLTVDVLGGDEFDQQVAVSGSVIDAVSARMPAFSPTREKLSGAGESLRGRSPLFAINGVPQSTPIRDGSRDGYTIDPFFIDRVEVIYGSNALQGIGATGGVVNQVTVGAPRADGWSFRTLNQAIAQDGFGGDTLGAKTASLGAYRSGAFDMTAGVSLERRGVFEDAEGRRIGVDGTQGEIQDSDSWSVFGRAAYQLTGSARVELVANHFELEGNGHYVLINGNRDEDEPATSELGEIEGAPPANRAQLLSLSLNDSDLAGGNLIAQAFFSRTRDIFGGGTFGTFQDPEIDPTGQLFDQSVNKSRKIGGKLSYERPLPGFDALVMTAGVDALIDRTAQTLLHTGREWVPQTDFRSVAPFVQGNLKLLDGKLRLAGGARHESVTLDVPDFTTLASYGAREVDGGTPSFNKTLFNGGVVVEPMAGLRGYAAYAEGYTIADVGRILRGITQVGVDIDNFLDLKPVVSNNREVGLEWNRGSLDASASYWWSDSDFGPLLVENADGIFDVVRAPISLEGIDLALDWRTPVQGLSLGGAYAYVKGGTDTDEDGEIDTDLDGANIAPNRLNLHADLERGPMNARLAMRHYFERTFDDGGPDDFEGYTLFDALVGYDIGRHRVTLGIQNLTDRQFTTYYADTREPTNAAGRLSDPRFFAGRGRTFTLGLTSNF